MGSDWISVAVRIRLDVRENHVERVAVHNVPAEAFDAIPAPLHTSDGTSWKVCAGVDFFKAVDA